MMKLSNYKSSLIKLIIIILTITAYVSLLYLVPRSNFLLTYLLIVFLFFLYYVIVKKMEILFSFRLCIAIAVIARLISVFSIPALSDDYFRFIWDGALWNRHISPYAYSPDIFILKQHDFYLNYLYDHMNSAEYYTVYPALLQYIFGFAAWIFPSNIHLSIIVLKIFILISECGTCYLLYHYCSLKKISHRNILWYFLNPMIIIELTGNVHFEAIMILFLFATLYFLEKEMILAAGIFWGLAICSKFLPLMLAPVFFMHQGIGKFVKFALAGIITSLIIFYPFIDASLFNIGDSLGKFYNLFEFNAGIYYFVKWVGSYFTFADISDEIAGVMGLITLLCILYISFFRFRKEQLLIRCMWIFTIYFLMATMVHPWYISTILVLASLSKYRYAIVFTFLIPLSYFPYSLKIFSENMQIIFFEYIFLFICIFIEIRYPTVIKKVWQLDNTCKNTNTR